VPTVSELKDRAREFEQKGELATALKIYRHILNHLEGTAALDAEIPLYVKVGDLSGKLGRGPDAVEAYRRAGAHYATTGSARSLNALALKVQRVAPEQRDDVYGYFARDLLAHGHDEAAIEVLREGAERAGLERVGEALAWARERSEEDARGVLVRLAEALVQGGEAAELEADAIVAPPAPASPPTPAPPPPPPPPPPEEEPVEEEQVEEQVEEAPPPEAEPLEEEPLRIDRSVEPQTAIGALPVMWSPDALGQDRPPEQPSDLPLATDRWREAVEQVAPPPVEPPAVETPLPPPPAPPEPMAMASIAPSGFDSAPLVTQPPVPPASPPPAPAARVEERRPSRRSAPDSRVLVDERRHPDRGRRWVAVTAIIVVVGVLAAALALGLIPLGGGGDGAERRAPGGAATAPPTEPPADPRAGPEGRTGTDAVSPPVAAVPDTAGRARTTDSAAAAASRLDSLALPPVSVPPVVVPTPIAPPPAPVDTTPRGPPTVRVPAGTTVRDWLIVVSGLTVESAVTVPLNGRTGRRVVHRLPDGEPLVLTAAPMAGADTVGVSDVRITVAGDTTAGSVRFWSSLVTARGRVEPDTLARLLRRLVRARPVR
jgi:hypothetical protein